MTAPEIASPWMTVQQVVAYTQTSRPTILAALKAHETGDGSVHPLKGYRANPDGGRWRIHVQDVDAWVRGEEPVSFPAQVTRSRRTA